MARRLRLVWIKYEASSSDATSTAISTYSRQTGWAAGVVVPGSWYPLSNSGGGKRISPCTPTHGISRIIRKAIAQIQQNEGLGLL